MVAQYCANCVIAKLEAINALELIVRDL